MSRIVKKPDIRRKEIMQVSENLFKNQGYMKTSVESIIKEVGIAKGTFYYYFKTKQDILLALVEQTALDMEAHFNSILNQKNLTAIQKFKQMIRGPEKTKMTSSPVMEIIHQAENRELQENLNIQSIKRIAPLIHQVLQEGKKEKIFKILPSLESIQVILAGSNFVLDSGLFDWSSKQRIRFLQSLQNTLELLTGCKPGILHFISEE